MPQRHPPTTCTTHFPPSPEPSLALPWRPSLFLGHRRRPLTRETPKSPPWLVVDPDAAAHHDVNCQSWAPFCLCACNVRQILFLSRSHPHFALLLRSQARSHECPLVNFSSSSLSRVGVWRSHSILCSDGERVCWHTLVRNWAATPAISPGRCTATPPQPRSRRTFHPGAGKTQVTVQDPPALQARSCRGSTLRP